MPLELACFTWESALLSALLVDRIELCANQKVGGTTPSVELFHHVKAATGAKTPINVMIRPRGGDFEYTDAEFDQMKRDITEFTSLPVHGFVFGILKDGKIDTNRCQELIQLAQERPCTFHRAFDELKDMKTGLSDVSYCGFQAILTSGGKHDAVHGIDTIRLLVDDAAAEFPQIDIIVGGGVRSTNIELIKTMTGASWFHSSALVKGLEFASSDELEAIKRVLDVNKS